MFRDPLALSLPDPDVAGGRWRTLGVVGTVAVFVVHTWPEPTAAGVEPTGRIISARKATARERRAYEEEQH